MSKVDEEMLETFYSRALNNANGENIKEDLRFYVTRSSYNDGDDGLAMAIKEGERRMALRILQLSGEFE